MTTQQTLDAGTLSTPRPSPRTLVITSCSKEKLDHPAPAKDLYVGTLFRLVRQYAERNQYDLRIISAKYGLVTPDQKLEPYDLQIQNTGDVDRVQKLALPELHKIWGEYGRVVVIMGKQYRKVINPILKHQVPWARQPHVMVTMVVDERGIGGLLQRVKMLLDGGQTA